MEEETESLTKCSFESEIVNNINKDLNNQIESCFIEGLKRKGFEFKNRAELELFIKYNCKCNDNVDLKERVYYVNNVPFFLYSYKIEVNQIPLSIDNAIKIKTDLGYYAFL